MEDEEMKFVCKWCNKTYPCGKSLGGHIRTHMMIHNDETPDESHEKKMSVLNGAKISCELGGSGGQTSYGLRENPKKTIKAVETRITRYPLPNNEKICRQCGKGFQSMKALCGHMAVHSEKEKGLKENDDDRSWTSEDNDDDDKTVMEEDTDDNSDSIGSEERMLTKSKAMEKRYINIDSSSVSEIDEHDREDVAMCLVMLSKDSSNWGGLNSVVESSDNNSVVFETKKDKDVEEENSDSGYYLNEYVKDESDGSVDGLHRIASFFDIKRRPKVNDTLAKFGRKGLVRRPDKPNNKVLNEPCKKAKVKGASLDADQHSKSAQNKRKYECLNCKKIFNSFQALGGHRPCHKRTSNFIDESNNYESEDNSLEVENDHPYKYDRKLARSPPPSKRKANAKVISHIVEKTASSKKIKTHECPYCHRVFKNGQALGGHKRSHFIGGNYVQKHYEEPVYKEEHPELLDLNLPAPAEDEDGEDFVSWKVGGTSRIID